MQQCRHIDEVALPDDPDNRVDPEAEARLIEPVRAGAEAGC